MIKGVFGTNERKKNPLNARDPFDIRIRVLENSFQVSFFVFKPFQESMQKCYLREYTKQHLGKIFVILFHFVQMFYNQTEYYVYKSRLSYNRIETLHIEGNGYLDFVRLGESYDVS